MSKNVKDNMFNICNIFNVSDALDVTITKEENPNQPVQIKSLKGERN